MVFPIVWHLVSVKRQKEGAGSGSQLGSIQNRCKASRERGQGRGQSQRLNLESRDMSFWRGEKRSWPEKM